MLRPPGTRKVYQALIYRVVLAAYLSKAMNRSNLGTGCVCRPVKWLELGLILRDHNERLTQAVRHM